MTSQDRTTSAHDDGAPGVPPDPERAAGPTGGAGEQTARERAGEAASTGREQAREVATTAGDQARSVASTAGDEASDVARAVGGQTRRLVGDARHELRSQADSQIERLAGGMDELSRQLRTMGERGEPGPATDLAGEAGRRAQQVADRLRQGGVDGAMGQLRSVGRNQPGLFLLGAFGAGLVAGRLARNVAQDPTDDGTV